MKRSRRGGAAIAVAVLFALHAAAEARVVEKIVAVVGEEVILQSEVEERAAPLMTDVASISDAAQREARAGAVRREILERLIDEQLLLQQAAELKLSVSSEEIDRSIEQIKKDYGLTDQALRDELRRTGMTMAGYRQNTRREILKYRVLSAAVWSRVTVTDKELQDYYDRNLKSGANVEVCARTVFLSIPENADNATVLEKEKAAKKILERAQAGDDFVTLAKEHSEDPATRSDGGDLGCFGKGMMPKPTEELVFSMKPGEVRGPIRVDRGFHVIKLVDRKVGDVKPLEEIKDELRQQIIQKERERATKSFLSELRKRTLVDVRL